MLNVCTNNTDAHDFQRREESEIHNTIGQEKSISDGEKCNGERTLLLSNGTIGINNSFVVQVTGDENALQSNVQFFFGEDVCFLVPAVEDMEVDMQQSEEVENVTNISPQSKEVENISNILLPEFQDMEHERQEVQIQEDELSWSQNVEETVTQRL